MYLRKYKWGDYINGNPGGLISIGGNLVDTIDPGNEFGVRSNLGAGASGFLKGASAGAALGPWGALAGGVIGGATSIFANNKAKKEEERIKREREELALQNIKNNSQAILSTYPTSGIMSAKYGAYLKMPAGGYLPYPTDGSEVEQLASNAAVYKGETHANGGIDIDTNQDQQPDVEIEDQEVIKDQMVLSNRLKPTKEILDTIKGLGVNIKQDDTYASLAERFAKKKGEYETNLNSTRIGESGTAKLMIDRLDSAIDNLFQDQQIQKMKEGINSNTMKYGGYLKSNFHGKSGYYVGSDFVPLKKMEDGGKLNNPDKPKRKITSTALATYFNSTNDLTKKFAEDRGWVSREDYDNWRKAWFDNNTPWGTDLKSNANLFWEEGGMRDVIQEFQNNPKTTRVHVGNFKGQELNKYLHPKGAPATYTPYQDNNAAIFEIEVDESSNTNESKANLPTMKNISKESNIYPMNFGAISVVSGASSNFKQPSGATKAYGMSYAYGGKLKKMTFGDYIPGSLTEDFTLSGKGGYPLMTPTLEDDLYSINPFSAKLNYIKSSTENPNRKFNYPINYKSLPINPLGFKQSAVNSNFDPSSLGKSIISGASNNVDINKEPFNLSTLSDNLGNIATGVGALANQAQINKLETEYTPELVSAPVYNFTSRLPYLRSQIDQAYTTARQGLRGSGAQDNQALQANLYAKSLESLNQATMDEFSREDMFKTRFNEMVNRNQMFNTEAINRARFGSMDNRNQRRALTQQNIDNTIRSVIGNQVAKDQQELDFVKNYMSLLKAGNTGVNKRILKGLNPRLRRRIFGNYVG